jgi:iron complex outermembrane receptor protein
MPVLLISATAQAAASEADSNTAGVEEIVVTARRMEERIQDVPISITVFSQKQLTDRNVTSGIDLATYTPSLSTNSQYGAEGISFAMRGFRQELNTTASVAVYFADVVAPRGGSAINAGDGAGPGSFFDLQNVQVLKGPQGTLFGRNTDGGAILLVPQKPTSQLEGYVEGSYGNYDMIRTQGVLNLPVNDEVRLRIGVDHESRDGYLRNISGIGPSDFNDIGFTAARASLVVDIAPNVENYTIASFTRSDHNGAGEKVFACNSNPTGRGLGFGFACPQIAREASYDFFTVENDLPNAETRMQQWQVINTTTWQTSDYLTIKNIVSYAQLKNYVQNDIFGTNFTLGAGLTPLISSTIETAPGYNINSESTTTEELQLQGHSNDNRFVWQAGGYAEFNEPVDKAGVQSGAVISCTDSATLECIDVLGTLAGHPGAVGSVNYRVGEIKFRDFGIYEQASYSLTGNLKLTEGLRYTMDRSEADVLSAFYRFPSPNTPVAICASSLSGSFGTPLASVADCPLSFTQNSHAPTWLVGLDYKPTDDLLLYSKYSRGYRQGSVNPYGAEGYNTYKPEKVDTYEIGTKTTFHSPVRGTFNVALFYNDFTDQQISVGFQCVNPVVSHCFGAQNLGIVNAGKSRIYGAEVESSISPFKGVTLDLSYAYLDTKLISLAPVALIPGGAYDFTQATAQVGGPLPLTPKSKATATAAYALPLPATFGQMSVATTYTYTSSTPQTAPTSSPYYKTAAYQLVNLNLDWNGIAGSRFDLGLFATNVFDKEYATFIPGLYNGFGFESEAIGEPRMYGARIRMHLDK